MSSTAGPALGPVHAPSLRDRERAEARARRNPWVWVREILAIIVVALLISSLLRAFIVQVFWIPSPSMRNTLVQDDRISVSRIDALRSNVHRGDVVVFDDTLGWLGSSEATSPSVLRKIGEFTGFVPGGGEQTLVKRVIGVGGDHVTCASATGKVSVNGVEQSCSTASCLITGLEPDHSYSIQVVATNKYGDSEATTVPYLHNATAKTPAAPVLTAGAGTVTAVWSPVDDPTGVGMTYDVRLSDGQVLRGLTGLQAEFTVAPGRGYTAQVRAVPNQGGPSDWSSSSNPVSPYGEPGAPGTPVITPNGGAVGVSWQAANGNGSPVTYTLHYTNGNASDSKSVGGATSTTISLSSGTWTFWVEADNGYGTRTSAQASYTFKSTPLPPSIPIVKATGNSGELSVNASPRAGNGWSVGDLSVEYSVDQVNWTGSSTIRGLADGRAYTVYARANGGGQYSEVVASSPVAPYGPPSAPSVSCSLDGTDKVTCTWSPGPTGDQPTRYKYKIKSEGDDSEDFEKGKISPGETFSTGIEPGETVTGCVRAKNDSGKSDWSCSSVTAPEMPDEGTLPVGAQKQFAVDYTQTCRPFGPWGTCYQMVFDITGNPNSTMSCGYYYRSGWDWSVYWYEEKVALDRNGYARHTFPGRTPNWNETVTCTQQ